MLCSDLAALPSSFQITLAGTCTGQQGLGGPAGETSVLPSVSVVCAVPKLQACRGVEGRLTLASGPGSRKCGCQSCRAENLSEVLSTLGWHVGTMAESCFN